MLGILMLARVFHLVRTMNGVMHTDEGYGAYSGFVGALIYRVAEGEGTPHDVGMRGG